MGKVIGEAPRIALVVGQLEVNRSLHNYRNRTATPNNSAAAAPGLGDRFNPHMLPSWSERSERVRQAGRSVAMRRRCGFT